METIEDALTKKCAHSKESVIHSYDGIYDVNSRYLVNYKAVSCNNVFGNNCSPLLHLIQDHNRVFTIIDSVVMDIYGRKIKAFFDAAGKNTNFVIVNCNELNKNLNTALEVIAKIEEKEIQRREQILAVGGGVLLDIAGFVSSIYRRGIPYISIPTTLMGIVDASIGIKTGINHLGRRNRLGSYNASKTILIDTGFLETLPRRETTNGLGEILKMAVIKDPILFDMLEEHGMELVETNMQKNPISKHVIHRSIGGMLEELAPNLWERNLERVVDFGHSFSPLIEMNSLPELLHGEAVALDVIFSSILSNQRGLLSDDELQRIFNVASSLNLMIHNALFHQVEILEEALADTMRHRNGAQNLPFPEGIGNCCFINNLSHDEIVSAIDTMKSLNWE